MALRKLDMSSRGVVSVHKPRRERIHLFPHLYITPSRNNHSSPRKNMGVCGGLA